MQTTGTFPELTAGRSKGKAKSKPEPQDKTPGFAGFSAKRRPRSLKKQPSSYAGRRAASHAKAYGD